jgi:cyclic pyranopterin phosphate synthase
MPLLDYCLERGYELRFIELMRMGHLASDSNAFLQQFVSLQQLLSLIGERYEYSRPMRHSMPRPCATRFRDGPFRCDRQRKRAVLRTCSAAPVLHRLVAWLFVLEQSSLRRRSAGQTASSALPALQRLLVKALGDKQEVAFSGGATVMKIIGG